MNKLTDMLLFNTDNLFLVAIPVSLIAILLTFVYTSSARWRSRSVSHTTNTATSQRELEQERVNSEADCEEVPTRERISKVMKTIEASLSEEQRQTEREVQRQQLEAIFSLLRENQEKFGEVSKEDMEEQLKFYK